MVDISSKFLIIVMFLDILNTMISSDVHSPNVVSAPAAH